MPISAPAAPDAPELTILMPCLNEAETLAGCIRQAAAFLAASGVAGEILVADNGSTDGSRAIAEAEGARVVAVAERGYGAALLGGIAAARGRFVIMGDADLSYDFGALMPFVERLRAGADLVMGNRFRGGIAPGAMPRSHRYLGNPVLSGLGRLFFRIPVGDFHCGLRGFARDRIRALGLSTMGMEFASEMVVRAALAGYWIEEVPTTLARDGRSRPPHLRTWRDGWRHLRFLLVYSPRWLFLYPGLVAIAVGLLGIALLLPGDLRIGASGLGVHTFLAACMLVLIGVQGITFAAVARRYATERGLLPRSARYGDLLDRLTPDRLVLIGVILGCTGVTGFLWALWQWASVGFGGLRDPIVLRIVALALTALVAAVQLWFTAFLAGLMAIPQRRADPAGPDAPRSSPDPGATDA
ncbi:MAG: glycosyltransferase family 2 protein [Chloroflexota bacterium]